MTHLLIYIPRDLSICTLNSQLQITVNNFQIFLWSNFFIYFEFIYFQLKRSVSYHFLFYDCFSFLYLIFKLKIVACEIQIRQDSYSAVMRVKYYFNYYFKYQNLQRVYLS